MADLQLIQMPFAAVERPSLGLSLLSARLGGAGIASSIRYANLEFAAEVGLSRYRLVEMTRNDDLVGEWIFAPAAFRDELPAGSDFFERVDLSAASLRVGSPAQIVDCLEELRRRAGLWLERLAQQLANQAPRILGASSMFQQQCASLALLRRVKELNSEIVTMLGGANCDGSMGRAAFQAFPWLDTVVCGEADELVVDLMQGARPGVRRLLEGKPVEQLDGLETPDFGDYFAQLATSSLAPQLRPGLLLETSRGCWWGQKHHCTFCGLNASGMNFRSKSAGRILQEMDELSGRYGLKRMELTDNILGMARFQDLLPALNDRDFTLFAEVKANLSRDQLAGLAAAGVRWIQPGIENLDERVLKIMDKGTSAAVNLQLLKWSREFGIFVSWNFLVGFPGECDEWYADLAGWLPWLTHLQPPQGVFRARFDRYSPYQSRPQDYGLRLRPHPAYAALFPLAPEVLADLAYFHLGQDQEWHPDLWDPHRMGPGLGALQDGCLAWMEAFWADLPAILSLQDDGQQLNILDTRPAARRRRHQLQGRQRLLLLACDAARAPSALARELGCPADELQPDLDRLAQDGLLLALPGPRYLALPVRGSLPRLLRPEEFPGGACKTQPALV